MLFYENIQDNFPDVYLSGPFFLKLNIQKVDTFFKYTFKYSRYYDSTSPQIEHVTLDIDTPGSKINRRTSLELTVDRSLFEYISLKLRMPIHNVKLNYKYISKSDRKEARAEFYLRNQPIANFHYILKQLRSTAFESEVLLTYFKKKILHWKGDYMVSDNKKHFDCTLDGAFLKSVSTLKGMNMDINYYTISKDRKLPYVFLK